MYIDGRLRATSLELRALILQENCYKLIIRVSVMVIVSLSSRQYAENSTHYAGDISQYA